MLSFGRSSPMVRPNSIGPLYMIDINWITSIDVYRSAAIPQVEGAPLVGKFHQVLDGGKQTPTAQGMSRQLVSATIAYTECQTIGLQCNVNDLNLNTFSSLIPFLFHQLKRPLSLFPPVMIWCWVAGILLRISDRAQKTWFNFSHRKAYCPSTTQV